LLQYDNLSETEKKQYEKEVDERLLVSGAFRTARFEGILEGEIIGREKGVAEGEAIGLEKGEAIGLEKGEAIGLEKGRFEERNKMVINSHLAGISIDVISSVTGVPPTEVAEILRIFNQSILK
jgi:hypothetical protein